jgi:hypothetical protein
MMYLCAKAIQNGAKPVWADEADEVLCENVMERTRELLMMALHGGKQNAA